MNAPYRSCVRFALLGSVLLSVTMIGAQLRSHAALRAMPGAVTLAAATLAILLVYGVLVWWITEDSIVWRERARRIGVRLGLIAAILQAAHIVLERFASLPPNWNGKVAIGFMLATFSLWGLAGYLASRQTHRFSAGILSGAWSAVVAMLLTVTFGFALELYWAVPNPDVVATWPEFQRSGWTDVQAFTIANTIESGLSHLLIGPVIGTLAAALASLFGSLQSETNFKP